MVCLLPFHFLILIIFPLATQTLFRTLFPVLFVTHIMTKTEKKTWNLKKTHESSFSAEVFFFACFPAHYMPSFHFVSLFSALMTLWLSVSVPLLLLSPPSSSSSSSSLLLLCLYTYLILFLSHCGLFFPCSMNSLSLSLPTVDIIKYERAKIWFSFMFVRSFVLYPIIPLKNDLPLR